MAWCQLGDKPLSEAIMVKLPTHMWLARPQWITHRRRFKQCRVTEAGLPRLVQIHLKSTLIQILRNLLSLLSHPQLPIVKIIWMLSLEFWNNFTVALEVMDETDFWIPFRHLDKIWNRPPLLSAIKVYDRGLVTIVAVGLVPFTAVNPRLKKPPV